ncbi:hypothetical protein PFLuk1_01039 [Pseudomonas fluorescens]|nr:hypothetical protein PFLuk1_01039 [Pseudomonas fluorescens]
MIGVQKVSILGGYIGEHRSSNHPESPDYIDRIQQTHDHNVDS